MFTAAVRVRTPTERQELLVEVMQKGLAFDWLVVDGHCYLYPLLAKGIIYQYHLSSSTISAVQDRVSRRMRNIQHSETS